MKPPLRFPAVFLLTSSWLLAADAPPGEQILAGLRKEHPRLLATAADFESLRGQVAKNAELGRWFSEIRKDADELLEKPVSTHEIRGGLRLLDTSRQVKQRTLALGLVFRLTGEERYAARLWKELEAAARFPDWNPRHFLDTAEMANALGLGYDWLHDEWTPGQRATLRQAIVEKGLKAGLTTRKTAWWRHARNNWNQVCYGGLGMGALAIADEEPALAAEVLHVALESLPFAMAEFGPDGAWGEGPGYWSYATEYAVYFFASLRTALGTDFDLPQAPGFPLTAEFPLHFTGPAGASFSFSDAGTRWGGAPQIFWLARTFDQPAAAAYQMKYAARKPHPLDLLWGSWWVPRSPQMSAMPPARHFRHVEVATLRSGWGDPAATFVGFKCGNNGITHSHLDLGSFVLDASGQRWALDLGADPLTYRADHKGSRWDVYRCRAEGHNTLVLNPGTAPDQNPKAAVAISHFGQKPDGGFAVADLSTAYTSSVADVRRGLMLQGRQVLVQDEVRSGTPVDLWWFMHTGAKIGNEGAVAILSQGGARLTARILAPAGAQFEILPAGPLPVSPNPPEQAVNKGVQKLAIRLPAVRDLRLAVLFTPDGDPAPPPELSPLSEWR